MKSVSPIHNDADYYEALARVDELMHFEDELEVLGVVVADWERRHYPTHVHSALEALKFRMEQGGLKPTHLIPYLGSRAKVSEVLSGKRQLSLTMRRKLLALGIPAEALLR